LNEKGQAIIFMAFLVALISLAGIVGVSQYQSSNLNISAYEHESRTYYAASSLEVVAQAQLTTYLMTNPAMTQPEMAAYLCAHLPGSTPRGYTLLNINAACSDTSFISLVGQSPSSTIPNGPYQGMNSPTTTYNLTVKVQETITGDVASISSVITIGDIFPFEFFLFSDLGSGPGTGYVQMNPTTAYSINGRVHVNGDFCVGGQLTLGNVTASGYLMDLNDSRCLDSQATSSVPIATDGSFTVFQTLTTSNDSGCGPSCGGSGLGWVDYDRYTWHGNVQDNLNGVIPLKLPILVASTAQNGYDQNWVSTSNSGSSRVIVDPVVSGGGGGGGKGQYAQMADLIIIDGVWYVSQSHVPRPTPVPTPLPTAVPLPTFAQWPGVPIWSDHPGSATDQFGNKVGQDDIRAFWALTTRPWVGTPNGYSYYSYDPTNNTINQNPALAQSIISYGSIDRTTVPTLSWGPAGFFGWSSGSQSANDLCGGSFACTPATSLAGPTVTASGCGATLATCSAGTNPSNATYILNATRSGFVDVDIQAASQAPNQIPRSNILPVNFDMRAFYTALANTNQGELGSYFSSGRQFNNMIYISSNWPGSLTGFSPAGNALDHPYQGAQADAVQPQSWSPSGQSALPYPLCSTVPSGGNPNGKAGLAFDQVGATGWFKVPDCATYSTISSATPNPALDNAFPNSIRIINADTITTPLAFVSNLPIYLTGNFNTASYANYANASGTPWSSTMIGGDMISVLSTGWSDGGAAWGVAPSAGSRIAGDTTIDSAFVTGFMFSPTAPGLEGIPPLLENWSGHNLNYAGSIYLGYYTVYYATPPATSGAATYQPPTKNFNYETHFGYPINQPPGTSNYPVYSVSKWIGH